MTDFGDRLWASLPSPTLLLDAHNRIAAANPAAEQFLNVSLRGLVGERAFGRLVVDPPVVSSVDRVRSGRAPLFINNVDVQASGRAAIPCNIQLAPLVGEAELVLLTIEMRLIAHRLGRARNAKSAARSAIGMSEMLAHEIKNPLAGIAGAAQLLGMNLAGEDREMTDLIVAETRRISKLLEQVEQFGNLSPPHRRPVNVHDLLTGHGNRPPWGSRPI